MNSKQLNFYSHPEEINKFIDFFLAKEAKITAEPYSSKNFELYHDADFLKTEKYIFRIILFKNNEDGKNLLTKFISTQNYFLFENMESNIIQFDYPTIKNKNFLYRGRFYFITAYWENGVLVKKDEEFINWATSILKKFKKEFLKAKEQRTNEYCTELVKSLIDDNKIELKVI
jgi:hypothetical protein